MHFCNACGYFLCIAVIKYGGGTLISSALWGALIFDLSDEWIMIGHCSIILKGIYREMAVLTLCYWETDKQVASICKNRMLFGWGKYLIVWISLHTAWFTLALDCQSTHITHLDSHRAMLWLIWFNTHPHVTSLPLHGIQCQIKQILSSYSYYITAAKTKHFNRW